MKKEVKPWDLINGSPRATEEKANTRFDICKDCPEFIQITSRCKKCGCIMSLKTKLEEATCPLGKW